MFRRMKQRKTKTWLIFQQEIKWKKQNSFTLIITLLVPTYFSPIHPFGAGNYITNYSPRPRDYLRMRQILIGLQIICGIFILKDSVNIINYLSGND